MSASKQPLFLRNKILFTLPYYLLILTAVAVDFFTVRRIEMFDLLTALGTALALNVVLWKLPIPQYAVIVVFLFFAEFGGMMMHLYDDVEWYDLVVHVGSGVMLTYIGHFLYTLILRKSGDKGEGLPVLLPAAFSFFFAGACAALWEIYEFFSDQVFGLNSQLGSLTDTMGDMIAGVSGALAAAVTLWLLLSRQKKKQKS